MIRTAAPLALIQGAYTAGNVPIFTATGLQDSGVALLTTLPATSVWGNNTSSTAVPAALTALTLGNGTAAAPIYSFNASAGTGIYSPATDYLGFAVGGNLMMRMRASDSTSYLEYLYSSGILLRGQGGTDINFTVAGNGVGEIFFKNNGASGASTIFRATRSGTAGSNANYLRLTTGAAGSGPVLSPVAEGTSDTDIDLQFSPAGAGVLRFGTRTAIGAETVTGYITIKDAGGTSRKLAVVS